MICQLDKCSSRCWFSTVVYSFTVTSHVEVKGQNRRVPPDIINDHEFMTKANLRWRTSSVVWSEEGRAPPGLCVNEYLSGFPQVFRGNWTDAHCATTLQPHSSWDSWWSCWWSWSPVRNLVGGWSSCSFPVDIMLIFKAWKRFIII